jgi:ABC-type spermidine/putrescine transport system permease subunit II
MSAKAFIGRNWLGGAIVGLVLAAMYAPVATVFVYSFNESKLGSVWTGFSTQWYPSLLQRHDLWMALRTSLLIGVVVSTLSTMLGTIAALGLAQWSKRSRSAAEGLLGLPLVVPDIIMAVSLAVFFNAIGAKLGLTTVVLSQVAFGLSYAFIVVSAAVQDLDPTLHSAALDCGATRWQAFRMITAPILTPSLAVAWMLVFSLSFDDFLITFFTKGRGNDTLPIKIYSQMRFGVRPDTNALFVLLFLITLAGTIFATWLQSRRR